MLTPGDPAPWFTARSTVNPTFQFDTVGGRYLFLSFFGSAGDPAGRRVLDDAEAVIAKFDVVNACFCGVSIDPDDEKLGRFHQQHPGVICFWDFDRTISRLYGTAVAQGPEYLRFTVVLSPSLRVIGVFPLEPAEGHVAQLVEFLDSLPPVPKMATFAPVLSLPWVFEPEFCRALIAEFDKHGGRDSGFMRDIDGKTVEIKDYAHKRRCDHDLTDPKLIKAAQTRLSRRLIPEIWKAFQFNATRIERNLVCRYDAATSDHFRAHRDNTTKGTAHRRFAVTLNLNAEEFEGGELRFPEFGPRTYKAPTGGAIVFSCSILHEATPVTKGQRYAFLPFLYDDEAAKVRQANLKFVGETPGG